MGRILDPLIWQLLHARQYGTTEEVLKIVDQMLWEKTGRIATSPEELHRKGHGQ